jgi:hypothetical protein
MVQNLKENKIKKIKIVKSLLLNREYLFFFFSSNNIAEPSLERQ